jgi:hypothetical protein
MPTGYGLDDPGSIIGYAKFLLHSVQTDWGLPNLLLVRYSGSFRSFFVPEIHAASSYYNLPHTQNVYMSQAYSIQQKINYNKMIPHYY